MAYGYNTTPCKDGKLYIAPIMDCFGGEIIALAMDDNMKKELCIKALKEAYTVRKPGDGVIHHSDAGSQYTSTAYKIELARHHAIQSMSAVGKCYDNARMESFFAALKKEKLYRIDTTKLKMQEVKKNCLEIRCLLQQAQDYLNESEWLSACNIQAKV